MAEKEKNNALYKKRKKYSKDTEKKNIEQ